MDPASDEDVLLQAIVAQDISGLEELVQERGRGLLSRRLSIGPDASAASCKWIPLHIAVALGKENVVGWMLQQRTCRAHLLQRDGFDHRQSEIASGGPPRTPKKRRRGQGGVSPLAQVEAHENAAAVAAEAIASAVGVSRGKAKDERPVHWNALHWAAHCGHVGILQMLLKECLTPTQEAANALDSEGAKISEGDWALLLRIAREQLEPLYMFTLTKKQRARERKALAMEEERGQLYSWGSGAYYALGNGTDQRRQEPRRVQAFSDGSVDLCAASKFVTLVRCSNAAEGESKFAPGQQLWSWGTGFAGQLGHGEQRLVQTLPLAVHPASFGRRRVSSLAAGREHSAFTTADGAVYTFGGGDRGQLGHGTFTGCASPVVLKAFRQAKVCVRSVYCGSFHTLAVTRCGTLYAWGAGTMGQTGLSVLEDEARPRKVPTFATSRVILVAAGTEHTVIVRDDNDVFLTGFGECVPQRMRLPQGYPSAINEKVRAASVVGHEASLLSITSLAAGSSQSILCTNRGEVYYHMEKAAHPPSGKESLAEGSLVLQSLPLPCSASIVSCGGPRTAVVVPQYREIWEWGTVEQLQEEVTPRKLRLGGVSDLVLSPKHSLAICRARRRRTRVPIPHSTLASDLLSARGLFTDAFIVPSLEPQKAVAVHRAMLGTCAGERLQGHLECKNLLLVALQCSRNDVETFVAELYGALPFHQEDAVAAARVAAAIGCTKPHTWPHIIQRMSLINRDAYQDMEFVVGGNKILHGNRFVAATRSQYLRSLLVEGFSEGGSTSLQLNVSANACEALLEYLYKDTITMQGEGEDLLEVYMVAKYLCLDRLIALCERLMAEELVCTSIPLMFEVASAFHSKALREELLRFSMQNLAELLSTGAFTSIPEPELEELQARVDTAIERLLESQKEEGLAREHLVIMCTKLGLSEEVLEEVILGKAGKMREAALKEERSIRKKLAQLEALREKIRSGKTLNHAQRNKLHQRRPLLEHLSCLTKRPADQLAREVSAATLASGSRSPQASPQAVSPASSLPPSPLLSPTSFPESPAHSPDVPCQDGPREPLSPLSLSPIVEEGMRHSQDSHGERQAEVPSSWQELATEEQADIKEETLQALPPARGVGRKARRRMANKKRQQQQQKEKEQQRGTPLQQPWKAGSMAEEAGRVPLSGSVDQQQEKSSISAVASTVRSFREIQEEERRAQQGKGSGEKRRPAMKLDKKAPTVTLYYGSSPSRIVQGKKACEKRQEARSSPATWAAAGSPPTATKSVLQLQQEEEQKKQRERAREMRERQRQRAVEKKAKKWRPKEGGEKTYTLSLADIQREEEERRRRVRQQARPSMRDILQEEELRARRARPTAADIEEEMLALALQASLAEQ